MAVLEILAGKVFFAAVNIIFGVLILAFPNFLRYLVGIYFILLGVLIWLL